MTMDSLAKIREALPGFSYADYLRHMKTVEAASHGATPLRIAILRTCTVEPVEPVLRMRLMLDGYAPSCWFGGYGQYATEILDASSGLYACHPHVVLLMVRIEEVEPEFTTAYARRTPAEWGDRLIAAAGELLSLARRAASELSAQVIVQNATLRRPYFGLHDAQVAMSQQQLVHRFNAALSAGAAAAPGVFVWDFESLVRARGAESLFDAKAWYVSQNPFRQASYPAIGADLHRYLTTVLGRQKKCVVVDLDNTLWGGLAGEDGIEGVRLGAAYPGNCYRDFQIELLKLHDRGILLAINSKNNEADALRVIDHHPDMVLRREHFAAVRINWRDKATNLHEIARELNIGMGSMVYLDDNPAECALVRQECAGCETVVLPDKPYLLPAVIDAIAELENVRLTDEDRAKSAMYRAQTARNEFAQQFVDLDAFLHSLDLEVSIEPATAFSIPRIAQLTQKTNQWNMTTRRYTEAEIHSFASDPSYAVLSMAARDRFGDQGIIGACIAVFQGTECVIDTLLLSCRVIGRGLEQALVAYLADLARARGAETLAAEFIPTRKNKPAEAFYGSIGLTRDRDAWYRTDLRTFTLTAPPHVHHRDLPAAPRLLARG
jgi:FkbH-like protein